MDWILFLGAVFNIIGGVGLLLAGFFRLPFGLFEVPPLPLIVPRDYMQYRLFTAGTAFAFGALYYYLYRNPVYVVPFLYFGTFLKYWALISSVIAYCRYQLPKHVLVGFGCSNGCVAVLFTLYLLHLG